MNREKHELWMLETKLLEDLLRRVEHEEFAILAKMQCTTRLADIYAILTGQQRPPWPKRTAARDKQRALHAMHVLALIDKTRGSVALGQENPRLAAHAALMAGIYAGNGAMNAALAARQSTEQRRKGQLGGQKKAETTLRHDSSIDRYARQWEISDELQERYPRSPVGHIHAKTQIPKRTIQSRLKVRASSSRK